MNNNYENINCNLVKENISQIIAYLKSANDNNVEQLIGSDAIWIALSKTKLTTALTENKSEVKKVITKLETYSAAIDLVKEIQTLKEQEKTTTDATALEELKTKINRLTQEVETKLSTI